uniref:Ribosome-binding factor A n=1 Tax=wastewater metagenome TaxID=527639 RepID=A0A0A8KXQ1_9ZZZZ
MTFRKARVADLILGFLGQEMRLLQDDRLQFLTLTSAEVSPDLKYATLYWTIPLRHVVNPNKQKSENAAANESIQFPTAEEVRILDEVLLEHKKFLRKRVGEELKLRYTPDLRFKYDYSEEAGYKIDQLLAKTTK